MELDLLCRGGRRAQLARLRELARLGDLVAGIRSRTRVEVQVRGGGERRRRGEAVVGVESCRAAGGATCRAGWRAACRSQTAGLVLVRKIAAAVIRVRVARVVVVSVVAHDEWRMVKLSAE